MYRRYTAIVPFYEINKLRLTSKVDTDCIITSPLTLHTISGMCLILTMSQHSLGARVRPKKRFCCVCVMIRYDDDSTFGHEVGNFDIAKYVRSKTWFLTHTPTQSDSD